jgi:hypothetical protein
VFKRHLFFFLTVLLILVSTGFGQSVPTSPDIRFTIVPLTVDSGFPLQVVLTEKSRFKVNQRVHGRIIEPVYAFDREVIPAGVEVEGVITGFDKGGKWAKISSMMSGDFTPVRTPKIRFETLILEDGKRMPIETSVDLGAGILVRFDDGLAKKESPLPSSESNQLRTLTNVGKQTSNDVLKGMLWGLAPYRPQSLPAGVRYRATLLRPLDFGTAIVRAGALDRVGADVPAGTIIYARLETPLNSRTTKSGTAVKAILTNPLYSPDRYLAYPVGSQLTGEVLKVKPASHLQHAGELEFTFTKIEPPVSVLTGWQTQNIDGEVQGVQVSPEMSRLRIDQEGSMRITQSKERFIAPALAMFNMGRGFNSTAESFSSALTGAYTGNIFNRLLIGGAGSGLGLPAGIAGRMIPPVGIGLGIYSAARSVFFNILSRGQEINFPVNTPIEIRVDAAQ